MLLLKGFRQALHADHVAVVHRGNGHGFGGLSRQVEQGGGHACAQEKRFPNVHRSALHPAPDLAGVIVFVVGHG